MENPLRLRKYSKERVKQIPFGNDNQKSKGNDKDKRGARSGR